MKFFALTALLLVSSAAHAGYQEACMIVEERAGNKDFAANELLLSDGLASQQAVELKLLENLKVTMQAGPALAGSDSKKHYAVIVKITDLLSDASLEQRAMIVNEGAAERIGKNLQSLSYKQGNGDSLEINCAGVER